MALFSRPLPCLLALALICGGRCLADEYEIGILRKLHEDSLQTALDNSKVRIYRMMIAPCWGNRFCLRVQTDKLGGYLVMKRLNGQFLKGILTESTMVRLTGAELEEFESLVKSSGLETMPEEGGLNGKDGSRWSFEMAKAGVHRMVVRWCPQDDRTNQKTDGMVKAFRWVTDKAGVTNKIVNKGEQEFPVQ